MKILFIYPNQLKAIQEQLGLAYLMGQAENDGHDVRLFDFTFNDCFQLEQLLRNWKPGVVGISAYTNEFEFVKRLSYFIKTVRHEVILLIGGIHATLCPEQVVNETCADYVVIGEADETLIQFLHGEIPAGFYNEELYLKKPTPPDIDKLAWPDHGAFKGHFRKDFYGRTGRLGMFLTSRGCPGKCSYCSNIELRNMHRSEFGFQQWTRFRDPKDVADEIFETAEKYNLTHFYLADDNATLKKPHMLKLCERLDGINLPWYCMARCDTSDPEMFNAMRNAGCEIVLMGIECGDERIRREVLNRRMSDAQIRSAFLFAREAGLKTVSFNMTGIPGEGNEEFEKTLILNKECEVDDAKMTIFTAIPNTPIFIKLREMRMLSPDFPMNYYEGTNIRLPNVTVEELKLRQERFYREVKAK